LLPRDELEARATTIASELVERLVGSAEDVDFRSGTYLLAAISAELGQHIYRRCIDLARNTNGSWELAAADADSLITGAWRCGETVSQLTERGM
jgi:hypothetical protein